MNSPIIIKLVSGLVNILACLLVLTIVLARQDWFGQGDTYAFVFWTLPLAAGLCVAGDVVTGLYRTRPWWRRLLVTGLVAGVVALGWTYGVALMLGPWMQTFSFPVLYLWFSGAVFQLLFLDWRLPPQAAKPAVWAVVRRVLAFPLVLVLLVVGLYAVTFAISYLNQPEKETYLIPAGYRGNVLVIFNQPDGQKPEYQAKRRIYRIPPTGVLFTQLKDEQGIIDQDYFYVSPSGQEQKLGVLDTRDFNEEWTTEKNPHEPPRDSVAVFNPGTMGTMGNSDEKDSKVFSQLYVGTYNDMKAAPEISSTYLDSLQRAGRSRKGL